MMMPSFATMGTAIKLSTHAIVDTAMKMGFFEIMNSTMRTMKIRTLIIPVDQSSKRRGVVRTPVFTNARRS
jgi:hypothetical protein